MSAILSIKKDSMRLDLAFQIVLKAEVAAAWIKMTAIMRKISISMMKTKLIKTAALAM